MPFPAAATPKCIARRRRRTCSRPPSERAGESTAPFSQSVGRGAGRATST